MAIRMTGGIWRGRLIAVPPGGVRPTQDRVRAALFSSLGEGVVGARVLDLFAGSGALGFEALSRGAADVCWVESDRRVGRVLLENAARLGVGAATHAAACGSGRLLVADVWRFLERSPDGAAAFDLVLADPPYARDDACLKKLLCALSGNPMVRAGGWCVVEGARRAPPPPEKIGEWACAREKHYGETRLVFYRRGS